MNKISKGLLLLFTHPVVLAKKLYARTRNTPIKKAINGVNFVFDFKYDSAMELMYSGTYESETIDTMKRFLKKGDTFIDVGANIGFISSIALGLVGKKGNGGQVHSFEPVPKYFSRLQNVLSDNPDYRIKINNLALSDKEGKASISVTNLKNIGWNTIVPGFMDKDTVQETIDIPTMRLDEYLKQNSITKIALIKIDTEGYEFPVLKGLSGFLDKAAAKPAILVELAPAAYPLLGLSLSQLADYLKGYGYEAHALDNINQTIDISKVTVTTNVVFTSKTK